jgi:hypothetical protein
MPRNFTNRWPRSVLIQKVLAQISLLHLLLSEKQDPLIERPIMSLWRRRQDYSDAMIGNIFITLAQIALTCAIVFLWFFG